MLEKLEYKELREEIHKIFYTFLSWEIVCNKNKEFDFEYLEAKTDEILKLIRRQGGSI